MDEPKVHAFERLREMSRAEVDDLPYGFIVLDGEGKILLYNRYEARMARLSPERVIGRNFFRQVAPCTRVEAFHGRFRALVDDPTRVHDRFSFRFHFLHGAQDVNVQLTRVPPEGAAAAEALAGARVFMTVERRAVDERAALPEALSLDVDQGRAQGPLGPVLPLSVEALGAALSRALPEDAREVGRALGLAIASSAAGAVRITGEPDLLSSPWQLAAAALDDAAARAGLGRVALDQSARAESGVIGCLVRPAVELPAPALAHLYEGLLEASLSFIVGRALESRFLDDGLLALPWRFGVAPVASADDLAPRAGEKADDVAKRLGLLVDEDTETPG